MTVSLFCYLLEMLRSKMKIRIRNSFLFLQIKRNTEEQAWTADPIIFQIYEIYLVLVKSFLNVSVKLAFSDVFRKLCRIVSVYNVTAYSFELSAIYYPGINCCNIWYCDWL
jgi:hypothetical protein